MPKHQDRFVQAARLWDRGDYKGAMTAYQRLLQEDTIPKEARALVCEYLGRLHAGLGDFAAAETFLRRAVTLAPDAIDHYVHLANCLCLCGRSEEAWEVIQRLYQSHPEHPEVMHYMGKMFDERGEHEKGLALMKKALRLDPNNARMLTDIAFSYLLHDNAGAAIVCSERALALNAQDDVVQFVHELTTTFEEQVRPRRAPRNSPSEKNLRQQRSPTRNMRRECK